MPSRVSFKWFSEPMSPRCLWSKRHDSTEDVSPRVCRQVAVCSDVSVVTAG